MITAKEILGGEGVRPVKDIDAARITEIYNHYILNTLITFEEHSLSTEEILAREHHNRVSVAGV